jgi:hypothetical protein
MSLAYKGIWKSTMMIQAVLSLATSMPGGLMKVVTWTFHHMPSIHMITWKSIGRR